MGRSRALVAVGLSTGALLLFLAVHALASGAPPPISRFQPLPLAGHQRLLVLAPHCDDETLGSAGVIMAAVRLGIEVRVVIATNGDGYLFATMEEYRRMFPRPQDFIRMGEQRQSESLDALAMLGVAADHVSFLSYPDRGTSALWNDHWRASEPYRSPFTGTSRSPYPTTYNPQSVYAGADLLADLMSILRDYRPDLILYPHPDDVHPDHWGVSAFTRLALATLERGDATYRPDAFAYLVHRPDFPTPKELLPDDPLLPPAALFQVAPQWYRFDIGHADALHKWDAIRRYRSQLPFLRELFQAFVRRNELFQKLDPVQLATVASGERLDPASWRDSAGQPLGPVQRDPVRDFVVSDALSSADLVALYAGRWPDGSLEVCVELRGDARATLDYVLRVNAVTADGVLPHVARRGGLPKADGRVEASGHYVCSDFPLASLGSPWAVFLGAEVRGPRVGILDQIAWQLVLLPQAAPVAQEG